MARMRLVYQDQRVLYGAFAPVRDAIDAEDWELFDQLIDEYITERTLELAEGFDRYRDQRIRYLDEQT